MEILDIGKGEVADEMDGFRSDIDVLVNNKPEGFLDEVLIAQQWFIDCVFLEAGCL